MNNLITLIKSIILVLLLIPSISLAARNIFFASQWWEVRSGSGNPGNGNWCDDENTVYVDSNGYLHLKANKVNGQWCQAEVIAHSYSYYGSHRFQVIKDLDLLDPDIVFGMFLYKQFDTPQFGCPLIGGVYVCEIDIEITDAFFVGPEIGTFTVQPGTGWYDCNQSPIHNTCVFDIDMPSGTYSSHEFTWLPSQIDFSSWHGHAASPITNTLMQDWRFPSSSGFIPPEEANLRTIIQMWVCSSDWCLDGDETLTENQEVIIKSYFGNQQPINYNLNVTISGSGSVTNGGGINCPSNCDETSPAGTIINLTANPNSGWSFDSWSGGADCIDGQVQLFNDITCIANFSQIPINLTNLVIEGLNSVDENTTIQYNSRAYFSDGSNQFVTTGSSWSENSVYSTISNSGSLTTLSVSSDQSVIITASYTTGGVTKSDTHTVAIINQVTTPTLTSLVIEGSNSVDENTNTQYNARAYFSDGSNQFVTTASSWSENSVYATISSIGYLTTSSVSSNQSVTISASYTTGGVTKSDTHAVTIINQVTTPTLTSLAISGATSVNENSNAQYTATATFSDSSTQTVTSPSTWSENSVYSTISSSGYLTTSSVSSNQSVTITASYTTGGVTKSDTHVVSILNQVSSCSYALISPNGGENWIAGSTHTIEWSKSGNACSSNVQLTLFISIFNSNIITSSTVNNGSFSWTISSSQALGDYYIGLKDLDSSLNYFSKNSFTISAPPSDIPLLNSISQNHILTSATQQQDWQYFYFDLDYTTESFEVDLTNLSADLDLYVKFGTKPTLADYDCRPYQGNITPENCIELNPPIGRWWVGINNYATGSIPYTVKASWIDENNVIFVDGFDTNSSVNSIASWKMDTGIGNEIIDTIGNHNGILTSALWLNNCFMNSCLEFSGGDSYFSVPSDSELSSITTIDLHFRLWLNNVETGGKQSIFESGDSSSNQVIIQFYSYDYGNTAVAGRLGFALKNASTSGWMGPQMLANRWYDVKFVYNLSTMIIYVDSVIVGSYSPGANFLTGLQTPIIFGSGFYGRLDEIILSE